MVEPKSLQPSTDTVADRVVFQNAVDHLTTAVLMFDEAGILLDMNPAAEELLDSSIRQICGVSSQELFIQVPELCGLLRRVVETGETVMEKQLEAQFSGAEAVSFDCAISSWIQPDQELRIVLELTRLNRHWQATRCICGFNSICLINKHGLIVDSMKDKQRWVIVTYVILCLCLL